MIFRLGEWYATSDNTDSQISDYEVLTMPLSHLYIMMIAIDKDHLVPASGGIGLVVNIMEHFIIDKELEGETADDKPMSGSDIKLAREEMEDMIDSFHRSILKYDDELTKKEDELDEKI